MKQVDVTWPRSWTHTVGREVARLRREIGWSAAALSDRCSEFGVDIPRNTITNLENGRKESLPFHELVILAAALLVAPVDLLFPGAKDTLHRDEDGNEIDEPTVEYSPGDVIPARQAWAKFVGDEESPRSVRVGEARHWAERIVQLLTDVQERP